MLRDTTNLPYFLEITTYNSKRKVATQNIKEIYWHDRKTDERKRLGAIAKCKTSIGSEYRVYYVRDGYSVDGRCDGTHDFRSWVVMDIFPTQVEAERYVTDVFHDKDTLKEEMFNVYVKLLQPLG